MKQSIGHQQQQKKSVLYLVFSVCDFLELFPGFLLPKKPSDELFVEVMWPNEILLSGHNKQANKQNLSKSEPPFMHLCSIRRRKEMVYLRSWCSDDVRVFPKMGVPYELQHSFFHLIIFNILSRSKMHPYTISICTLKLFPVLARFFCSG